MADSNSWILLNRSKGLTEIGLAGLGYNDTIVFRPGHLANAQREKPRLMEKVVGGITGIMAKVSSSIEIDVSVLATAMLKAGKIGSTNLPASAQAYKAGPENAGFTAIDNSGAIALGEADV